VVFITGHFQENQIRNQVQTEKAFGYITKPFDINEVSKLIKTVALNIQKE
jgi:DNA-binding NtrC family response regulator